MQGEPIVIEQRIDALPERVWRAISDREEMRHWYFDVTRFWPELGCDFQFTEIKDGKKYVQLCRITNIVERKKLAYTCRYEGLPGHSEVIFELIPADKQTILRLTHTGVDSFAENGPEFSRKEFKKRWNQIIRQSLKDFSEREIINKSVTIHADTPFVWQVLTDPEFTSKWMSVQKKGMCIESTWKEDSEVVWKEGDGTVVARGVVTVNHPGHYMKIYFPCYDEESCKLRPGEDYQIYMLTGISFDQSVLEVECNTITAHTGQLDSFWNVALKKIKQMAEKMMKEAFIME